MFQSAIAKMVIYIINYSVLSFDRFYNVVFQTGITMLCYRQVLQCCVTDRYYNGVLQTGITIVCYIANLNNRVYIQISLWLQRVHIKNNSHVISTGYKWKKKHMYYGYCMIY